jgi:putative restriction endonuclease
MSERIFGHAPGYPEGSLFENRAELNASRVHIPTQAGISGSQTEGAESIVLSGGYEDDADYGDVTIYTGHGGRDTSTGQQTHDQPFTRGNRALALSNRPSTRFRTAEKRGYRGS